MKKVIFVLLGLLLFTGVNANIEISNGESYVSGGESAFIGVCPMYYPSPVSLGCGVDGEVIVLKRDNNGCAIKYGCRLETKPIICAQDAKKCPNGLYVSRTGPNCEFPKCPSETKPIICAQDAKKCSDGSYVTRTGPNCEFAKCPVDKIIPNKTYKKDIGSYSFFRKLINFFNFSNFKLY